MNRLDRVGETLRAALNGLAVIAPEWLTAVAEPEWFKRYGSRVENFNLPKTDAGRAQFATIIGLDGKKLLQAIEKSIDRERLRAVTEILILQRVWDEQFVDDDDGQPRLCELKEIPPPAILVSSPYDHEARFSTKRGKSWVGYKLHLTESCDYDAPRLLTNVETTPATTPDDNMVEVVQSIASRSQFTPGIALGRQGIHRRQSAGE